MSTLWILVEGLIRHLAWWAGAVLNPRDVRAPIRLRRGLFLIFAMPVFIAVQAMHAVCLLLDEILFPRYRRIRIGRALFITGIPRSGTSFLQRTLALDTDRYTSLTTWEALFAPSITQRRIIRGIAALDRRCGRPAGRALHSLTRRLTGTLDDIHEVGLEAPEEDYLVLMPAAGCFIMLLAFPGALDLQNLGHFDRRMPSARRRRLLRFYERCLQRHLYADGCGRCLLSKNAALGSWLQGLHEQFPEARFIVCIREPAEALSSQISSIGGAQGLAGTAVRTAPIQKIFLDMFADTLDHLARTLTRWPVGRAAVIDMEDLRAEPGSLIRGTLTALDHAPGPGLARHLAVLRGKTTSGHRHRVGELALDKTVMERCMQPSYRRLLALPNRVRRGT